MSEINTVGDEYVYGGVVPGYALIEVKNVIYPWYDGKPVPPNFWGLTACNDPDFIFWYPPEKYDDDIVERELKNQMSYIFKVEEHYNSMLNGSVERCYDLYKACKKAGYIRRHGRLSEWLMNKMYETMISCKKPIVYECMTRSYIGKLEKCLKKEKT